MSTARTVYIYHMFLFTHEINESNKYSFTVLRYDIAEAKKENSRIFKYVDIYGIHIYVEL